MIEICNHTTKLNKFSLHFTKKYESTYFLMRLEFKLNCEFITTMKEVDKLYWQLGCFIASLIWQPRYYGAAALEICDTVYCLFLLTSRSNWHGKHFISNPVWNIARKHFSKETASRHNNPHCQGEEEILQVVHTDGRGWRWSVLQYTAVRGAAGPGRGDLQTAQCQCGTGQQDPKVDRCDRLKQAHNRQIVANF